MTPLVSIVVICYNHAAFIHRNIASIKDQTYKNYELILMDDCSTDNSTAVYDKILQQLSLHARKSYHDKNVGLCRTLNEALSLCNGKYIKLLAADDYLHPASIEKCVERLESEDDSFGVVFSNAAFVDEHGTVKDELLHPPGTEVEEGWIFDRLMQSCIIPALTAMVKRDVYDKLGGYDETIWIDDYEFWLRASQYYQFAYIPEVLAYYRIHGNNVSITKDMTEAEWQILTKHDPEGKYKKRVNAFARNRFVGMKDRAKAISLLTAYPYHDKFLAFCLKSNLPGIVYKIYYKVFHS